MAGRSDDRRRDGTGWISLRPGERKLSRRAHNGGACGEQGPKWRDLEVVDCASLIHPTALSEGVSVLAAGCRVSLGHRRGGSVRLFRSVRYVDECYQIKGCTEQALVGRVIVFGRSTLPFHPLWGARFGVRGPRRPSSVP